MTGRVNNIPGKISTNNTRKNGVSWFHVLVPTLLLIAGMAAVVGHHLYYRYLDSRPVQSLSEQTWALRIGTGLAYVYKTLLVAVMGIFSVQVIWATLRHKFVALKGIDSMFSIMSDPTEIFSRDLFVKAKTVLIFAVISW